MNDKKDKTITDKQYKALINDMAKDDPALGQLLDSVAKMERMFPVQTKYFHARGRELHEYYTAMKKGGFTPDQAFKLVINYINGGRA